MRPNESFVGQPIRSLQTMLQVLAQDDPRHGSVIPDGIYGPETVAAVSVFQRAHGLPVTGITDRITWETLVSEYEPALIRTGEAQCVEFILEPGEVIRRGQRHPHLYTVQAILMTLAEVYGSIGMPAVTGVLDDDTAGALETFQALSGLPMTGHLDKNTWKHLALQYPLAVSRRYVTG